MAEVLFYEKPGCINNTRQKKLLAEAGHTVIAHNLLTEAWTAERLLTFFKDRPVPEWFNRTAPAVKSGDVVPEALTAEQALVLMIADPILIRRPLMQVEQACQQGFEPEQVATWIGLNPVASDTDLETCPRQQAPCSSE